MWNLLFWLYFINGNLLIGHEIDSAYWNEWKLFKVPGGIAGFLVFNFIVLPPFLYGIVLVHQKTFAGLVLSLILGLIGIFTFFIHIYFMKKGHKEFKAPMSLLILLSTLIVSIIQIVIVIKLFIA